MSVAADEGYTGFGNTQFGSLVVDKARVSPGITVTDIVFGDDESIIVSFKDDLNVTGTVTIYVNNISETFSIVDGVVNGTGIILLLIKATLYNSLMVTSQALLRIK